MPPTLNFGFNPYENIKVTLKHQSPREQDCDQNYKLNITSMGMHKPISFKTRFDPESQFLNMVTHILEEMELLEVNPEMTEDSATQIAMTETQDQIEQRRSQFRDQISIEIPSIVQVEQPK